MSYGAGRQSTFSPLGRADHHPAFKDSGLFLASETPAQGGGGTLFVLRNTLFATSHTDRGNLRVREKEVEVRRQNAEWLEWSALPVETHRGHMCVYSNHEPLGNANLVKRCFCPLPPVSLSPIPIALLIFSYL